MLTTSQRPYYAKIMNAKCTAITLAGKPCKNWPMHGTKLCAAHSGKLGAAAGNQNAVKHAFYRPALTADEVAALLTHAENMSLEDELAISRVTLLRLLTYLKSADLEFQELSSVAPLIFTGSRTVAHLVREIADSGRTHSIWDEVLDQMSRDLDIQL